MILLCLLFQLSLDFVILKKTGPEVALKVIKYDVIANYNQTDFPYDRDAIERLQQEVDYEHLVCWIINVDEWPEAYPRSQL